MKLTNEQNGLLKVNGVIDMKTMTILDKVQKKQLKIPVQVRLPQDLHVKFAAVAKSKGVSYTSLFRTILEYAIEEASLKKRAKRNN